MKRRRVLTLVMACGVIGVVGALVWPGEREPEYNGKKLSECGDRGPQEADAIRHIGTNALPWLLKWMQYDYPAWRSKLSAAAWRLPGPVRNSFAVDWMRGDRAARLSESATAGFEILGPEASPAIPELTRLANDQEFPNRSWNATRALGFVGKEAFPSLLAVLANPRQTSRGWAAFALSNLGSNAAPAVPTLVECLKDTNLWARLGAASTLGELRLEPDVVVPALTNCLQASNAMLRRIAMGSLGNFGGQAFCAVPSLRSALNDRNPKVRLSASNALYRITPEALPGAIPEPKAQSRRSEEPEK